MSAADSSFLALAWTGNVEVGQAVAVRRRLRYAVGRLAWGLIEVIVVALVLKVGGCQTTSIVHSTEAKMRSLPTALYGLIWSGSGLHSIISEHIRTCTHVSQATHAEY